MTLPEAESSEWIKISVKYPNVCEVCRAEVLQGEQAFWARGSKRIKHISCSSNNNKSLQVTSASEISAIHPPPSTTVSDNGSNPAVNIRYCGHCGFSLTQIGLAKFCPSCGGSLSQSEISADKDAKASKAGLASKKDSYDAPLPLEKLQGFDSDDGGAGGGSDDLSKNRTPPVSIEELGRRLEDMTAQILANMGYSTEKRQILLGKSKSRNEIDIVAKKGGKLLAVECKNYSRYVGADQLREFKSKLDDLQIENALFVTNVVFSKDAELFANHHHIRLWDGRMLRENFFSMTIGRLGAAQEIVLKDALPVSVSIEQVSWLHLANPSAVRLQRPRLVFHPYYKYDYRLDIARQDPGRGVHRVKDEGSVIVDALDGEILSSQGRASRLFSRFASSTNLSEADEAVASREEHQVILDISNIKAERNYRIAQSKEFDVVKLEYGVLYKSAMYSVVSKIIEDNTKEVAYSVRVSKNETQRRRMPIIPKSSEVYIKKISMVYVPMWSLDIEGNGGISYSRRVLAASGVTLVDSIAHCPKHLTLGKMQFIKRQTYAVCEICGGAFCKDHISQVGGIFYCQQHTPSDTHSTDDTRAEAKKGMLGTLKKGSSGIRR